MSTPRRYPIPADAARTEVPVSNSRFIASAAYTPTVEAAREFIATLRAEMPDANHHCYAFLVGFGESVTAGMSDDGEPAGTAGRPMLAVVRGSGLGDITVVVTRFFGGTKLGTGGLVRAYSDATKAVLDILPRTERIERRSGSVLVPYANYTVVRSALDLHHATIRDEEFATDVTIYFSIPVDDWEVCCDVISERTAAQAIIEADPTS